MKKTTELLLAAVVAVGLTSASQVLGGQPNPVHPRGHPAHQFAHIAGINNDVNFVSGEYNSAAIRPRPLRDTVTLSSGEPGVNLARRGSSELYTGRNPARDFRKPEFQIAPLK